MSSDLISIPSKLETAYCHRNAHLPALRAESQPKISIVTAVFNAGNTIASAIESVLAQSYANIEHVIIDGMSSDGTDQVVQQYAGRLAKVVREPDRGIYDALNKGIQHATGQIIGFLHADDLLAHSDVISKIADQFADAPVDAVYGNLRYVEAARPNKTVRYWRARSFDIRRFNFGWMPPHPTCYFRRECYDRYGGFRTDLGISADYELLVRMMVRHRVSVAYIDDLLVNMRLGGKSNQSLFNRLLANREDAKAWPLNNMKAPMLLRLTKPVRKVGQYAKHFPGRVARRVGRSIPFRKAEPTSK